MDIADLKEILRILEEQDITEFELEQDGVKLRVCRSSAASPAAPAAPVAALAPAIVGTAPGPSPVVAVEAAAAAGPVGTIVKSPIVGTFYRAPDPNSSPFVSVGDRVKVGQVLCIIEAMKLMNEIESDVAGVVQKVYPGNGQPVEFGEPLFSVKTD